jgi:hypothetical protein
MAPDIIIDAAQLILLRTLLTTSDELCTAVISGKPGKMKLALAVAGAIAGVRNLPAFKRNGLAFT